jgi:hypothetical protein
VRHDVLPASCGEHELEQDPLLELLDGVDDGAALVSANRPGSEDPSGREHVHAKGDIANPSVPDSSTLLFLFLWSPHKHSRVIHGRRIRAER